MGRTSEKAANPNPPYTPTDRERLAIERVKKRWASTRPAPTFSVGSPAANVVNISADR